MSFRPTIALYFQGEIADIRYYRNAGGLSLLAEAAFLASLYGECQNRETYMACRYGQGKVFLSLEPVLLEHTQENLKFLESCSEYPLIVDCTARCVYRAYHAMEERELAARPVLGGPDCPLERVNSGTDLLDLMSGCVIPFSLFAACRKL